MSAMPARTTSSPARPTSSGADGLRSGLYPGVVVHRRRGEIDHDLRQRVVMGLFDLDELDLLDREVTGFGVDRPAPVAFRTDDHGRADGSDLRDWFTEVTAGAGVRDVSGPLQVLSMPRVLGYAFDPISVWFGHDAGGRPSAVVHEVRNTFGQRHAYVVPDPLAGRVGPDPEGATVVRHRADKAFHVSPFFDVDGTYDFTLRMPDDRAALGILHHAGDGHTLTASFTGRRRAFTTAGLWRSMARHPLLPQAVTGGIHLHAARLWAKGATYRPVPDHDRGVTTGCPVTHDREPATEVAA
ncbi:DUF1365 domain-containing protein [Salsipaludibacter albus]|uniref:DUF1365 domain-containing protein n=1 Tax=Salsipaludibacter albus TaxID=2849650 RepID=UPI001EE44E47|nr:DUF1365 domain-containing protein [Salsipaludibacter albus]MBY5162944.1 DUF1365 domain-containing protein [Salsipaludibacter albus]